MDARRESDPTPMKNPTTVERKSERELVITRTFNGPARIVFEAWTKAELFKRWWVPKSFGLTLLSCEMDVRSGGTYRLVFKHPASGEPMAFFGRYNDAIASQATSGFGETFEQLDDLLLNQDTGVGR